ncbi:MAG TPA: peptidoglycan-binding domain-containing protein [Xanthobacteraceae bacterium]|nr:peptidoglycan-binding domain-containing protein [Xanthobacteraceae bacterium]
MRKRRNRNRPLYARLGGAGGTLAMRAWTGATKRPIDTTAILAAAAVSAVIVVNALFLQSGPHQAPFLANPKPEPMVSKEAPRPGAPMLPRPSTMAVVAQPVALRRDDPIADMIVSSPRIAAVQRALSDYGYGQIQPSGILDDATLAAIEKFERDRHLPVGGEVTDRLMRELAALVGHPLQ